MAAVTVNTKKEDVHGSRAAYYYNIDIAANNDTLDTLLSDIDHVSPTPETSGGCGCTISGGVITFKVAGALTGVRVKVEGTGR